MAEGAKKLQIPKPKSQVNFNSQIPKTVYVDCLCFSAVFALRFTWDLRLGILDLLHSPNQGQLFLFSIRVIRGSIK